MNNELDPYGEEDWDNDIKTKFVDHHYKPPQEFIDSVMKMENMSDADAHKHVNMLLIKHLKGL